MISSLMYWEFDRGNCVLSDLNTAMSVWVLVGWIIQRLGEVVGPVEGNRLKQLVGPLVVWMVPQIDGTIIFFSKFNWKSFFKWMPEIHFIENVYKFSELSKDTPC